MRLICNNQPDKANETEFVAATKTAYNEQIVRGFCFLLWLQSETDSYYFCANDQFVDSDKLY